MARILIATDGSDYAIAAARWAMGVLAPPEQVIVQCVIDLRAEMPVGGSGGLLGADPLATALADPVTTAEIDQAMTKDAEQALARTIGALGVRAEGRVDHGDPATEICRVAEEAGVDLVIVGSHGSGFVKRVLMGSVSHHVSHHAPCPVLVVRHPRQPKGSLEQ